MNESVAAMFAKVLAFGKWCASTGDKAARTFAAVGRFTAELGDIWGQPQPRSARPTAPDLHIVTESEAPEPAEQPASTGEES